jgi:hypothetical protein
MSARLCGPFRQRRKREALFRTRTGDPFLTIHAFPLFAGSGCWSEMPIAGLFGLDGLAALADVAQMCPKSSPRLCFDAGRSAGEVDDLGLASATLKVTKSPDRDGVARVDCHRVAKQLLGLLNRSDRFVCAPEADHCDPPATGDHLDDLRRPLGLPAETVEPAATALQQVGLVSERLAQPAKADLRPAPCVRVPSDPRGAPVGRRDRGPARAQTDGLSRHVRSRDGRAGWRRAHKRRSPDRGGSAHIAGCRTERPAAHLPQPR